MTDFAFPGRPQSAASNSRYWPFLESPRPQTSPAPDPATAGRYLPTNTLNALQETIARQLLGTRPKTLRNLGGGMGSRPASRTGGARGGVVRGLMIEGSHTGQEVLVSATVKRTPVDERPLSRSSSISRPKSSEAESR
eukprot:RCo013810